jgi:hypothetical protein
VKKTHAQRKLSALAILKTRAPQHLPKLFYFIVYEKTLSFIFGPGQLIPFAATLTFVLVRKRDRRKRLTAAQQNMRVAGTKGSVTPYSDVRLIIIYYGKVTFSRATAATSVGQCCPNVWYTRNFFTAF